MNYNTALVRMITDSETLVITAEYDIVILGFQITNIHAVEAATFSALIRRGTESSYVVKDYPVGVNESKNPIDSKSRIVLVEGDKLYFRINKADGTYENAGEIAVDAVVSYSSLGNTIFKVYYDKAKEELTPTAINAAWAEHTHDLLHNHSNKTIIDGFDTASGRLLWNGNYIEEALRSVTATNNGLMTKEDKIKFDTVEENANFYVHPDHTGIVTSTSDGETFVTENSITNAHLSKMPAYTLKGNPEGVESTSIDLTQAQIRTLIASYTPTADTIPLADSSNKIDAGWLPAATTSVAGVSTLVEMPTASLRGRITSGTGAVENLSFAVVAQRISTTTPSINAIPRTASGTTLDPNWLPDASEVAKGCLPKATISDATEGVSNSLMLTPATSGARVNFTVTDTTDATSFTEAPFKAMGGAAVAKNIAIGGKVLATGGLGVGNSSTSSPDVTGTTKSRKIQVFDATGSSIGFLQVYAGS